MGELERELELAREILSKNPPSTSTSAAAAAPPTLPIGVGLLPFILPLDSALPVLQKYAPAVVWLFAAKTLDDYAAWTRRLKAALPHTSVWVQVGSASAALHVAQGQAGGEGAADADADASAARPDALVIQGSDAGGHGFSHGASIVSLLPETVDVLSSSPSHGPSNMMIPLLAAGGIADARGAAAAFALGASGVVLGTRFLAARDGANSTVRSTLFDNVRGPNVWPAAYDGRGLVTRSYEDFVGGGVAIEEVRRRHDEAAKQEDRGFKGESESGSGSASASASASGRGRANVWAGASVGLVNEVQDAKDIVAEVRDGVARVLADADARARL